MSKIRIDLTQTKADIRNVQANLQKLKGEARASNLKAARDTSYKFQEISDDYVPVITGVLKGSTTRKDLKDGTGVEYSKETDYAHKVELRRGYFRTPLASNEQQLIAYYEQTFNNYFY